MLGNKYYVPVIIGIVGVCGLAFALKAENLAYHYPSFQAASTADSSIRFQMVHRKLGGLMASTFDGTVKAFTINGEMADNTLDDAVVRFNVLDIDTNNTMRNNKMDNDCFNAKAYPTMAVYFDKPLKLGSQAVPGHIEVLGAKKPVQLPITIQDNGSSYKAMGTTSVTLTDLGIPKPNFISDTIASVDNKVKISYQVTVPKSQL